LQTAQQVENLQIADLEEYAHAVIVEHSRLRLGAGTAEVIRFDTGQNPINPLPYAPV
jgi:hypothetical protein